MSTIVAWVQPGTPPMMPLPVSTLMRSDPNVVDYVSIISGPRIASARNEVVREFLKHDSKADWLFMVDTDMTFEPDIVQRLRAKAEAIQAQHSLDMPPVMGALCFAGGRAGRMYPTLFQIVDPKANNGDPIRTVYDYPRHAVCKVDATGAACLLVHRSVLDAVHARYGTTEVKGQTIPFPVPWFAETVHNGREIGEDTTFCMRVGMVGGSVFVDTSTVAGHLKMVVLDEEAYDAQRERESRDRAVVRPVEEPAPTFVVIPMKDRVELTRSLVSQLRAQGGADAIFVFDNGSVEKASKDWLNKERSRDRVTVINAAGWGLHQMWNHGLGMARSVSRRCNIAILNNDLRIGPRFLSSLADALRSDPKLWAVSPCYDARQIAGVEYTTSTAKNGGLAGFAFMLKGEAPLNFDEGFAWWYGDDNLVADIEAKGYKVGLCGSTFVEHIGGGSQTVQYDVAIREQIERDKARMFQRWGRY